MLYGYVINLSELVEPDDVKRSLDLMYGRFGCNANSGPIVYVADTYCGFCAKLCISLRHSHLTITSHTFRAIRGTARRSAYSILQNIY